MATPQFTVAQIAHACAGRFVGDAKSANAVVTGVAALHDARPDTISWIADVKHAKHLAECPAAAIIGTETLLAGHPRGIVVTNPDAAIADVLDKFEIPAEPPPPGKHPTAVIHDSASIAPTARIGAHAIVHAGATIAENAVIHEGVSIGRDVSIGAGTVLYDRVVIYDRCRIGDRVILHAGAVIGADGFGFFFQNNRLRKFSHIGTVIIENDVEIGPNSVVDRGKFGPTRIGQGTKIDALVMIGHNVQIGPLCVLAGQAGLSGSVKLGAGVAMGGQAGIVPGITIGDRARIAAQSGITKDVAAGDAIQGTPAQTIKTEMRNVVLVRKLHKLYDEVAELTRRVKELEASANHR
ncbi:MAG: UDP-3-O-(3-hydroxymyristoyl)glucosamine N-acyltransferase [Planctomycetes bacterium]|nr:UDP-3-O-(3-hydroxymyristoyl)glucosamine N-acyltransferase [Planctomycetota bacterium]